MTILLFTLIVGAASILIGFLSALTGVGGAIVIIPLLVLIFGIGIHQAAGAALLAVIATSSGAAAAYVKEGYTNIRIGILLELATTFGAVAGAYLTTMVNTSYIAIALGCVLLFSAYISIKPRKTEEHQVATDHLAEVFQLNSSYPGVEGERFYKVAGVIPGFLVMLIAGVLSGLLGIGSGPLKVLAMDQIMRLPFKVSTTTSNFMIGVTAAASAGVYFKHGYVLPDLAMPVVLGVLIGSFIGAKVLFRTKTNWLRIIFAALVFLMAVEMIAHGLGGKI